LAESSAEKSRRLCPTRASGAHSLIAHWITPATCLERQRRNYHKCFTCQYRGQGADVVLAVPPKAHAPEPVAEVVPVRRARSKAPKAPVKTRR
jgi:hypothetical protein